MYFVRRIPFRIVPLSEYYFDVQQQLKLPVMHQNIEKIDRSSVIALLEPIRRQNFGFEWRERVGLGLTKVYIRKRKYIIYFYMCAVLYIA